MRSEPSPVSRALGGLGLRSIGPALMGGRIADLAVHRFSAELHRSLLWLSRCNTELGELLIRPFYGVARFGHHCGDSGIVLRHGSPRTHVHTDFSISWAVAAVGARPHLC